MTKNKKDEHVHEFDVITNGGSVEILKFGDEVIELKPLKVRQIRELLSIVRTALPIALKDIEKYVKDSANESEPNNKQINQVMLNVISNFSVVGALLTTEITDKITEFICKHIGKDVDWFDNLEDPEVAIKILDIMCKQSKIYEYFPFFQRLQGGR